MGLIKDKYRAFRRWQQQPFDYQDTDNHHGCCNCGKEYVNNYCPRCGQKAVHGPITWKSVGQGVLDVWGVGTRSLPYSLWQLIWRPGYLIRDYISGKRQVSFPPVKMLVIVAVVLVLVNTFLGVNYNDDTSVAPALGSDVYNAFLNSVFDWMSDHIEWAALTAFSMFVIPIWFLFRQAPRLPRHTLPQGFYIQVFIGVQFLFLMLLTILVFWMIPSTSGSGDEVSAVMVLLVLPIMLLVDYKQLFGYGWWGTFWRVLVAIPFMFLVFKVLKGLGGAVYTLYVGDWHNMALYVMRGVNSLATIWVLIEVIHLINNKPWRGGSWTVALWRPLLAIVAWLLVTIVSGQLGFENSIDSMLRTLDALFWTD